MQDKSEDHRKLDDNVRYGRTKQENIILSYAIPTLAVISILICLLPEHTLIPAWVIFLLNIPLTIRIVGMSHELFHEPIEHFSSNLLLRINLHVYTPFTVGFNEYRKIHLLHHTYTNTDKDPDYWMIKSGRLMSPLRLAFAPEYWFFYCIKHGLVSKDFWLLYVGRMVVLALYIYLLGLDRYLVLYLIPTKIAFLFSFMVFSYESHIDESGNVGGSWNLKPKLWLLNSIVRIFIGPYAYNIAYYHANHHAFPWVSGRKLNNMSDLENYDNSAISTRQVLI